VWRGSSWYDGDALAARRKARGLRSGYGWVGERKVAGNGGHRAFFLGRPMARQKSPPPSMARHGTRGLWWAGLFFQMRPTGLRKPENIFFLYLFFVRKN
jgi:hypothetical protein